MNRTVDYYKILQLNQGAAKAEITAAYRRLCKLYHPDINDSPDAEETMKWINLAYTALSDDAAKVAPRTMKSTPKAANRWDNDVQKSAECVNIYFTGLLNGDFAKSYEVLSEHDKKYVTFQSFCEWRKSVQRLFSIRSFTMKPVTQVFANKLRDGTEVPAVRHMVTVMERNLSRQTVESYKANKIAIMEPGGWRVFLGYRDLNEIAKVFQDLSMEQEQGEMTRHWEEYCNNTCRELNMLNLTGFLEKSKPELYRYKRYKQHMVVACFRVKPVSSSASQEMTADLIEASSKVMSQMLRETDIIAYLGGGIFVILFVELRKKHAELITQRIANRLRGSMHKELRASVYADCNYSIFEGGDLEEYVSRCSRF